MKFYAVKNGREVGIFTSWSECEAAVKGYSGAEYKSFKSEKDALAYLNDEVIETQNNDLEIEQKITNKDELIAYIDGSYNTETNEYACGIVCINLYDMVEFSFKGQNEKVATLRNVAGEILGVLKTLELVKESQYKKITIYYDYEGIEKWVTGEWKAKNPTTQKYSTLVNEFKKQIDIKFVKVKAHSGDPLNERADKLAKEQLGL